MLPQRPGPPRGRESLRSPFALAWRLHRGTLIGWVTGALIYGVIVGSAAKGIGGLLGSSQIRHIMAGLGGKTAITNAYLAAIMSFGGVIGGRNAGFAVLRARAEETPGHAGPGAATRTKPGSLGVSAPPVS